MAITVPIVAALLATVYVLFIGFGKELHPHPVYDGVASPAFAVVDLPGRGKGLVATRNIKQGELLIKEKPLILVPSSTSMSPSVLIKQHLSLLSPSKRNEFYSLSYVTPANDQVPASTESLSDDEVALAIFQTNAISAGENAGIFPWTARLNHGCSAAFNSVYSWRPGEGIIVVHALKSVKRGDELLTTYTDTKKSREERQHYLKSFYDFPCTCSVCSLPDPESAASDDRLTRMSSLSQTFASWGHGQIDGKEATRIANEIWTLGKEEVYWSERGRLAADAAHVAAAHSDKRAAVAWALLAFNWYAIELGEDSTQAQEMRAVVSNPQSHLAWASRYPQFVELPTSDD
ncbi:hypothetical protein DFH11DRAFT_1508453 [Phellopilus nigrolimitatus]|nr:hypothetical protein DFH11DRAFT_1508453 [Phellopilus nigrolimitatus]